MDIVKLLEEKKKVLSRSSYLFYLNRNIKRLKTNIKEYNLKAEDIENAYPDMDCDKWTRLDWEYYQDCIKSDKKKLNIFLNEIGGL